MDGDASHVDSVKLESTASPPQSEQLPTQEGHGDRGQQEEMLLAFPEERLLAGGELVGERNNSSSSSELKHAVYSTQHRLDVKEESKIPYATGTNDSEAAGSVSETLGDPTELKVQEIGAETALVDMAISSQQGVFYVGLQNFMDGRGDDGIGEESYRLNQEISQGNHDSSQGNSSHVCRYCRREFTSGRALGGHMRAHGSVGSFSMDSDGMGATNMEYSPEMELSNADSRGVWNSAKAEGSGCEEEERSGDDQGKMKEEEVREEEEATSRMRLSSSSEMNNNGCGAVVYAAASSKKEVEDDDDKNAKLLGQQPLYALRRNPKRSRRFIDQDYTVQEMVPPAAPSSMSGGLPKKGSSSSSSMFLVENSKATRACTECGKEFSSWKALFGHMRCHPEREWRGIQPPAGKKMAMEKSVQQQQQQLMRRRRRRRIAIARSSDGSESGSENNKINNSNSNNYRDDDGEDDCKDEDDFSRDHDLERDDDDQSDTESIEAAYMNCSDHQSLLLHLQGSFRGKRSRRSRLTVRSLHTVSSDPPPLPPPQSTHFPPDSTQFVAQFSLPSPPPPRLVADLVAPPLASTPSELRDERDMATCLVMLALAGTTHDAEKKSSLDRQATDESAFSGFEWNRPIVGCESDGEELDWGGKWQQAAKAAKIETENASYSEEMEEGMNNNGKSKFECSTCKRSFRSHQALGGHRASHKKVKGCFARTNGGDGEAVNSVKMEAEGPAKFGGEDSKEAANYNQQQQQQQQQPPLNLVIRGDLSSFRRKAKGHQCSICLRVFSTGQALGGHKRCHWGGEKASEASSKAAEFSSFAAATGKQLQLHPGGGGGLVGGGQVRNVKDELLDLNLPAPVEEEEEDDDEEEETEEDHRTMEALDLNAFGRLGAKSAGAFLALGPTSQHELHSGHDHRLLLRQQEAQLHHLHHRDRLRHLHQQVELQKLRDNRDAAASAPAPASASSLEALRNHPKTHPSVVPPSITPIPA